MPKTLDQGDYVRRAQAMLDAYPLFDVPRAEWVEVCRGLLDALLQSSEGPRCDCGAALTMCADCIIGDYQAAHPECTACCPVQPAEGRETPDLHEDETAQAHADELRALARLLRCADRPNEVIAVTLRRIEAIEAGAAALAHGRQERHTKG
jgi:hypothetical protein